MGGQTEIILTAKKAIKEGAKMKIHQILEPNPDESFNLSAKIRAKTTFDPNFKEKEGGNHLIGTATGYEKNGRVYIFGRRND
jgi:hypothetical protein